MGTKLVTRDIYKTVSNLGSTPAAYEWKQESLLDCIDKGNLIVGIASLY